MIDQTNVILSCVSIILIIIVAITGALVWRGSLNKAASEIQERVIAALKEEVNTLRSKLEEVRTENKQLKNMFETLCIALKPRGIEVHIEDDLIIIKDIQAASSTVAKIKEPDDDGNHRP